MTGTEALFFFLMMQTAGFICGIFISGLYHFAKWQ